MLASEPFGRNGGITDRVNTPEDDQRELIERAQAGEATAFERLAQRYAGRLWRSALTLCQDAHWAEDLVQETLVAAWQSVGRYDGRSGFSSWIFGILRHKFLKGRRQQNAARHSAAEGLYQTPSVTDTPDRSAEHSEDARWIRRAVANLPDEHRLTVELRFFAGATLDEIAAALGCPLGTVKSRLHHALTKLRQMNPTVNIFSSDRE